MARHCQRCLHLRKIVRQRREKSRAERRRRKHDLKQRKKWKIAWRSRAFGALWAIACLIVGKILEKILDIWLEAILSEILKMIATMLL
jgi:Na+/citrate or Na+/malate symporter